MIDEAKVANICRVNALHNPQYDRTYIEYYVVAVVPEEVCKKFQRSTKHTNYIDGSSFNGDLVIPYRGECGQCTRPNPVVYKKEESARTIAEKWRKKVQDEFVYFDISTYGSHPEFAESRKRYLEMLTQPEVEFRVIQRKVHEVMEFDFAVLDS